MDAVTEAVQRRKRGRTMTDIITYCDVIAECKDCPMYGKSCCGERKE